MLTHHVPAAVYPPAGNYVHGVSVPAGARLLFISGTMGLRPDGGVPETFEEQCELAWQSVMAILADAGMNKDNLVKVTTFLAHTGDRFKNVEIRDRILGDHKIAVTTVRAGLHESGWKLEMEAVAAG